MMDMSRAIFAGEAESVNQSYYQNHGSPLMTSLYTNLMHVRFHQGILDDSFDEESCGFLLSV
jgi:hypothetical protein